MSADRVDIDELTGQLSLQDWRAARGGMYRALRELAAARASLDAVRNVVFTTGWGETDALATRDALYAALADDPHSAVNVQRRARWERLGRTP